MGQAAVDLPNSPDSAPAPLGNADDLLSQLAGREIDRLLAEADDKPDADPPASDRADSPAPTDAEIQELLAPTKVEELSARNIDLPPAAAQVAAAAPQAPPATHNASKTTRSTSAPDGEPYAAEIDDVFKNIESTIPRMESATPAPLPAEPEQQTSVAERNALNSAPSLEIGLEPRVHRTPIYVRMLELINAPFRSCPDTLRDTLGKIAILTTMNALGILLYLLMFK